MAFPGVPPERLRGTSRNYVPFMILATPRTGSNLLTAMLNSHPEAVVFGEVYDLPYVIFAVQGYPDPHSQALLEQRNRAPVEFLQKTVFTSYAGHVKAVGFKAFPHHFRAQPKLLRHLRARTDLRIVHVYRKNRLRQYLSHQIALKSNKWYSAATRPGELAKIRIDVAHLLSYLSPDNVDEQNIRDFLADTDQKVLSVAYEDLLADPAGALSRMLQFLSLSDAVELKSPQRKQGVLGLSEMIENYDEVKNALSSTPWSSFLDMEEPEGITSTISVAN